MRGTSRSRGPMKPMIDRFMVQDAANTIARAREHLQNKPLMNAVRRHVQSMSAAVDGDLRPKPVKPKRLR